MARRDRRAGTRTGTGPRTKTGARPGTKTGRGPGTRTGTRPGTKAGARPGTKAAARPGAKAGTRTQTAPPRAHETLPEVKLGPAAPPRAGEWLFTTRPGAEHDLLEELFYADAEAAPHPVAPSLVAARRRPGEPAFARQGLPVADVVVTAEIGRALGRALAAAGAPQPWALDVFVPDSDEGNRLAARASELAVSVPGWQAHRVADARAALADNGLYAQACLLPPGNTAAVGVLPARDAVSLAPGGRLRVHVPESAPSRAATKLLEAFHWLDRAPEAGDLCVDLGAAPGGWSWALLERRARVIAVDPAYLARSLQGRRGLQHLRADAFKFTPPDDVDWLFSDMAWRPLESAALLAKWARRGWARFLVANIKLPMKKKAAMLVRVREILDDGGWKNLRVRQLYHDREEVTVAAVRL